MKNIIDKIKNSITGNKQKILLFGSIALVMVLIIIAISFVVKIVGIKISYVELEKKLEKAAYTYLSENQANLPTITNPTVVVTTDELIAGNYIKELRKYVKDPSCTANVIVDYIGINDYKYQAYLTCNNFKTEKFIDTIKDNNTISQVGEGLYEMNNELVFRGQAPNNYVSFADRLWRIVKINKEGNINLIITSEKVEIHEEWDDRYNTEKESQKGINNFLLSRSFSNLKNHYKMNLEQFKEYLVPFDLCVGKRLSSSTDKSGNLECNEKIENQYIGLLPTYDYMNASLDGLCQTTISKECQNYNYLSENKYKWWTMTGDVSTTYDVFYVSYKGQIEADYAIGKAENRYVIALNSDVLYNSGNGTKENPYVIR